MLRFRSYERRHQRIASTSRFLGRFTSNLMIAAAIIAIALGVGMAGYASFEGMGPIDSFLNASMILSGMGPVAEIKTSAGKLFAGCYALASGLIVVAATGLVLAPILHRVLHHFHCDAE